MTPRIFTKPTGVGGGIANPTCFANMAPLRIAIVYYSAHGHIRKMAQVSQGPLLVSELNCA
jgi:hypothetical protein